MHREGVWKTGAIKGRRVEDGDTRLGPDGPARDGPGPGTPSLGDGPGGPNCDGPGLGPGGPNCDGPGPGGPGLGPSGPGLGPGVAGVYALEG